MDNIIFIGNQIWINGAQGWMEISLDELDSALEVLDFEAEGRGISFEEFDLWNVAQLTLEDRRFKAIASDLEYS